MSMPWYQGIFFLSENRQNRLMWVPASAGTGGLKPASTYWGANFHGSRSALAVQEI